MSAGPWQLPEIEAESGGQNQWIEAMLARNSRCAYLRRFGSPRTPDDFRRRVPIIAYEDVQPFLTRILAGERDVLFDGAPVAYERTGGSSGGCKLIPYSAQGLLDFQRSITPWLAHTARRHRLSGKAYFSISPVARAAEFVGGAPVGLPDGAYLGDMAGALLMQRSAVPFDVAGISDLDRWREATRAHLKAARDLEMISVWSPTFLLRLCDGIGDTRALWPDLKVISCWASGPAKRYIEGVSRMFPQAAIEPKGLMSTEAVVTVPDEACRPVLASCGFVEFRKEDSCVLASDLVAETEYEVVLTTASGLYRYASGDRVRCQGVNESGDPVLEFVGRDSLTSDLVGEKLTEAFVGQCIGEFDGLAMIVPDVRTPGYVLISERNVAPERLSELDERLCQNPQYRYARRLGQLAPLRMLVCRHPFDIVERVMSARGVRLGDIKPTALRAEDFWLSLFEESQT